MSPGACCRLEATGFAEVYDYVLGIADRMAAGLPTEGEALDIQRIADATRPDIPTARSDELLGTVFDRTANAGWDEALVIDCDGIVIARPRGNTNATYPSNRSWNSGRRQSDPTCCLNLS
jgi:hypothetical protein